MDSGNGSIGSMRLLVGLSTLGFNGTTETQEILAMKCMLDFCIPKIPSGVHP